MSADGRTAYVGAFAGGGSAVVRLADLAGTPKPVARVGTPLWVAHPFIASSGEVIVIGRAGASGHKLERYTRDLQRLGEPLLLSRGSPT